MGEVAWPWHSPGKGQGRCKGRHLHCQGALPNLSPGCLRQDLIRLQPNSRICHQTGSGEDPSISTTNRGTASVCPSVWSDVASGAC